VSDIIVGIDLGTTNSLVGAVVDGKVRLFADDNKDELLPSVVGINEKGRVIVGRSARNRRLLDPEGTVGSVKRKMGQDVRVRLGKKQYSPAQVSAMILSALLDRAQERLGERPTRAVITVPAWFDDRQREATRTAGELAGLTVERLVNEPTAAAMTYQSGGEECVLVYDLGGGTFDVSILDRDEGFLEVRSSRGDTQLGGDDVDRALVELVLGRLGDQRRAIDGDPRALARLTEAVERAKIALSDREEVKLFDPFLAGTGDAAVHLDMPVTRSDVDEVARPFVERTLKCIDDALRDAKVEPSSLQRVLLVGGSSKMPIVAGMVSKHLGMPVLVDANADRAVALGASMLAGRAAGAEIDEILVDITPHTLAAGVVDLDDEEALLSSPVIERDTVVPVERTRTYYTVVENQPAVRVPVTQGEEEYVDDNTYLGEVWVEDLPPAPARSPVEVTFQLDLSGVLHVSAKHVPSGKSANVTFRDSPYRLTDQQRREARAEVAMLQSSSGDELTKGERELAQALVVRAAKALEQAGEGDERKRVQETKAALEGALEAGDTRVRELGDMLSDALFDLM
jgi:molecular chaperone DnaK